MKEVHYIEREVTILGNKRRINKYTAFGVADRDGNFKLKSMKGRIFTKTIDNSADSNKHAA